MAKYDIKLPSVSLPKLHNEKLVTVCDYLEHKSWDIGQGFNAYRLLAAILKKANENAEFLVKLKCFIENSSTLELRELCEPFGNYWDSSALQFQNAVDALDTCFGKTGRESGFPVRFDSLAEALDRTMGIILNGEMHHIDCLELSESIVHLKNPSTGKQSEYTFDELDAESAEIELVGLQPIIF